MNLDNLFTQLQELHEKGAELELPVMVYQSPWLVQQVHHVEFSEDLYQEPAIIIYVNP